MNKEARKERRTKSTEGINRKPTYNQKRAITKKEIKFTVKKTF